MKKLSMVLLTTLSISAISAANASVNTLSYIAKDNTAESKLCAIAANNGYAAAKREGRRLHVNSVYSLTCNGQAIADFAASNVVEKKIETKIKFVPANSDLESKACVTALEQGLSAVKDYSRDLECNGLRVKNFVKKYASL